MVKTEKNTNEKEPMEEAMNNIEQKKAAKKTIIVSVIAILALAAGLLLWVNRVFLTDVFLSWQYKPSAEMAEIEKKVGFSSYGEIVFKASAPSLNSRDDFNEHCRSHDQTISVLGCYTGGHIYLYNIQSDELKGVKESTAAHELLHAVWQRMDSAERKRISGYLNKVYEDSKYHDLLADDLETYDSLERIDELHSRVGTEIADLPAELEKHYAKYFNNQDLVVDFYNSYIEPFEELEDEIEHLSAELEKLDAEIETKTEDYYKRGSELSKKIDEFNSCASTAGCFKLESVFYATRNTLLSEQSSLENLFNELNRLIEHYNAVVAEYNSNILRGESLERIMNSNAEPESVIK